MYSSWEMWKIVSVFVVTSHDWRDKQSTLTTVSLVQWRTTYEALDNPLPVVWQRKPLQDALHSGKQLTDTWTACSSSNIESNTVERCTRAVSAMVKHRLFMHSHTLNSHSSSHNHHDSVSEELRARKHRVVTHSKLWFVSMITVRTVNRMIT